MKRRIFLAAWAVSLLIVAGCGGGSSSESATTGSVTDQQGSVVSVWDQIPAEFGAFGDKIDVGKDVIALGYSTVENDGCKIVLADQNRVILPGWPYNTYGATCFQLVLGPRYVGAVYSVMDTETEWHKELAIFDRDGPLVESTRSSDTNLPISIYLSARGT